MRNVMSHNKSTTHPESIKKPRNIINNDEESGNFSERDPNKTIKVTDRVETPDPKKNDKQ